MTGSLQTPFARLVLFMIFLSVAGSVVAGVYYFAAVQPDQKPDHTPINRVCDYNKCVEAERDKAYQYIEKYGWKFCPMCPDIGIPCDTVNSMCDCRKDPCAYGND